MLYDVGSVLTGTPWRRQAARIRWWTSVDYRQRHVIAVMIVARWSGCFVSTEGRAIAVAA
jgi:hypothetical protein